MLHHVLHQDDGASRIAGRLVVDLEAEQDAGVYHVLEYRIP